MSDPAALPDPTIPGTTVRYHIDEHLRPILRAVLNHPNVTLIRRPKTTKETPVKITKTTLTLTLAAALALGMGACTLEEPTAPTAVETATPHQRNEPAPKPEPEPEVEEFDGVGTFGETASWDGVDVTVSKPEPYNPSEWAAGADLFEHSVAVTVTLTNTGSVKLDPSMAYVTASSGGVEASEIFDDSVGGAPMTSILPGESTTYKVALNVSDPADVVVEFTPGFDFEAVLFTNEAGL